MTTTSSLSSIRSSVDISPVSWVSSASRGVAKAARTSASSSLITSQLATLVGQDGLELGDGLAQPVELVLELAGGTAG